MLGVWTYVVTSTVRCTGVYITLVWTMKWTTARFLVRLWLFKNTYEKSKSPDLYALRRFTVYACMKHALVRYGTVLVRYGIRYIDTTYIINTYIVTLPF